MEYITKSLTAMSLAVATALLYAIGAACMVGAYASVTPTTLATATDLLTAGGWLQFVAGLAAVALVCAAGWELVPRRAWIGLWEIAVAAAGTVLVMIGLLLSAISHQSSSAANVVTSVGVGVWSLLVLVRAARSSLAVQRPASEIAPHEQPHPGQALSRPGEAKLWLVAALGLLILAVGTGFTSSVDDKGISIAAGVLEAVGVAVLFGALAAARAGRLLSSTAVPVMLAGLFTLAAGFAAGAVVAGLVFGPDATLTGFRVGVSIAQTLVFAAAVVLGIAAWSRLREIVFRSRGVGSHPA